MRVLAAIPFLLVACGGDADTTNASFSGAPMATVSSDGGLSIAVRSSPAPVVRGVDAFELTITRAGALVDGLSLEVNPWMTSHNHGSSVKPEVSAAGNGVYVVKNVSLYMPGRWELRVAIAGDVQAQGQDHGSISVDVP